VRNNVRSEWCKLLRRGQVLGTWGTMAGMGLLLAILVMANAGTPPPPPEACTGPTPDLAACQAALQQRSQEEQRSGPTIDVALIEATDGWVLPFSATGQILGIVALVVAAGNLATEYTSGTLKGLLVREPRRTVLLGGKILAIWGFVTVGIAITLVLTTSTTVVLAFLRGIATDAWFTPEGFGKLAMAFLNVTLAAWMWALLGLMLAMVFRSGPPAIGIGIAYPLLVEGLLGLVLPDMVKWMPGQVLAAVGNGPGGNGAFAGAQAQGLEYLPALLIAIVYSAAFLGISMGLLKHRDVT
jgi:ABC-2 type transport system permease protein